jgi:hypothetical protein
MGEDVNQTFETATVAISGGNASLSRSHALLGGLFTSASFFAAESRKMENLDDATEDDKQRHRAFVLGAVTCSALSLEAYINEFYIDCTEGSSNLPEKFRGDSVLQSHWIVLEQVREKTLVKFEAAVTRCAGKPYDKSRAPYQDAVLLIDLRNFIVHYKSERDTELNKHAKLERQLTGKFPECSMYAANALWFPHRCLSAGCAEWSVKTAEALVDDFRSQTGYTRSVRRYKAAASS